MVLVFLFFLVAFPCTVQKRHETENPVSRMNIKPIDIQYQGIFKTTQNYIIAFPHFRDENQRVLERLRPVSQAG